MITFDFVECASKAYGYVWHNRQEVLRISGALLAFKIFSFFIVIALQLDENLLRQGLILLPSHLFEGWVIAHIMINALTSEESDAYKIAAPDSEADFKRRVLSSALIYVLLKLILSFLAGITFMDMQSAADHTPAEPGPGLFFMSTMLIIFLVWSFRFLWLYIPVLLGKTPIEFLIKIKPLSSSLYMLGLWVMCFVPIGLGLIAVSELISGLFPTTATGDDLPALKKYLSGIFQAAFDYVMVLVSSLGMAYAISSIFNDEDKNVSIW